MVEEPCARKLASTVLKQRVGQRCPTRLHLNPFKTDGRQPNLPDNVHTVSQYAVLNLTAATVTIALTSFLAAGDLAGGQIGFAGTTTTTTWTITDNTPQINGSTVITVATAGVATLTSAGLTTSNSAIIGGAAPANVTLNFYVESTVSVDLDGIQLEERSFRTSMIFQEAEIRVRARSTLIYRQSPFEGLKTFGIHFYLKEWRGDGNIFQADNVASWIADGKLYVKAGDITVVSNQVLSTSAKVFIQIAEENSALSVYINGILESRVSITSFVATVGAKLDLTSAGLRNFRRFLVTDQLLTEGQSTIGKAAFGEVAKLFNESEVIIDPVAISCPLPMIPLAAVTVPPPALPIAKAQINGVNRNGDILTVDNPANFVNNQLVSILRNGVVISTPNIIGISASNFTINTTAGIILIGDTIIYGNVNTPGQCSVRFPYSTTDLQTITGVDPNTRQVTVQQSVLSFIRSRAFVTDGTTYADKTEVIVESIDLNNRILVLNDVSRIAVGDVISQPTPDSELRVDIGNYFGGIINTSPGLSVKKLYINGLILQNTNPYSIIARPYIRLIM